jgi:hypothetical protein
MNRYSDVIQRDAVERDRPWVVELKVDAGKGQAQYFRNAIVQAVLHREFIRKGAQVRPWFNDHDLDSTLCRAGIAFPKLRGPDAHQTKLRTGATTLASLFDVSVFEVDVGHL